MSNIYFLENIIQGSTSLHAACQMGHSGIAEILLSQEASVSIRDSEGQTALHLCAKGGHNHTAKVTVFSVSSEMGNVLTSLHRKETVT